MGVAMQESVLSKTLEGNIFDNVFTELKHSETLGLVNPNELRIFYLDVMNNVFSFDALQDFLLRNIGQYVFSRARMERFELEGDVRSVALRAVRLMIKTGIPDQKGTGNELGEILLYAFLEQVLKAPKIMSKVELANFQNRYGSKSDGVHLLTRNDISSPCYQLVFGASSVIGDIQDAIDKAFEAVEEIETGRADEYQLVECTVFDKKFDEVTTERLKQLLIPSKRSVSLDTAYGIFLGYSLGLDAEKYTNPQFRAEMKKKMELDIKQHATYISQKIKDLRLGTHSFYIYVLPFNDATADKKDIMNELLGGGV